MLRVGGGGLMEFDAESKFAIKKFFFAKNFLSFQTKIGTVLFWTLSTEWFPYTKYRRTTKSCLSLFRKTTRRLWFVSKKESSEQNAARQTSRYGSISRWLQTVCLHKHFNNILFWIESWSRIIVRNLEKDEVSSHTVNLGYGGLCKMYVWPWVLWNWEDRIKDRWNIFCIILWNRSAHKKVTPVDWRES